MTQIKHMVDAYRGAAPKAERYLNWSENCAEGKF